MMKLPWSTTWQQLKEIFQEYNVKYADVKMGYDGRSRGYGIVRFDSEEEACAALALNGYIIDGREMLYALLKPTLCRICCEYSHACAAHMPF